MTNKRQISNRGYFGIGIEHTKVEQNIGTLWRSAHILGASFIFTIGKRYLKQSSDTSKAWQHVPLYHYVTFNNFYDAMPKSCQLIGIEQDLAARPLHTFLHPERCIYLLGAEDHGLTQKALAHCHKMVILPGDYSMNVATAGSLVMYDRWVKNIQKIAINSRKRG